MTTFQFIALLLTVIWLVIVVVRFRRSTLALMIGLVALALFTIAALALGKVTLMQLGMGPVHSWLLMLVLTLVWLGLMLAYSPLADRLATRWFAKPPTLEAFGAIQQSVTKLIAGILAAWLLGGILEELIARGIVLMSVDSLLAGWLPVPVAAALAICIAAIGAGLMHFYQGPRAVVIITQLSILFGILFVISGYNLWAVVICHGLYDTIAFIRFATKKSRYSNLEGE
ncbi:MAG TPA: CPBP family intramembrane glutamic endopeptidase [Anaerolineales bacterium]|nr:CPBP family intramembrane glutamic endopeptidase [Anaerolineales bacterium]